MQLYALHEVPEGQSVETQTDLIYSLLQSASSVVGLILPWPTQHGVLAEDAVTGVGVAIADEDVD